MQDNKKLLSYEEMNQIIREEMELSINGKNVTILPTGHGHYEVEADNELMMLLDYKYYNNADVDYTDYVDVEETVAEVLERVCDDGDLWLKEQLSVYYQEKAKQLYPIAKEIYEDKAIIEKGDRNGRPVALVRWNKSGREEYLIAFEYKVTDNNLHWGYGYYYDGNIDKAKTDFNKVIKGGNLSKTFDTRGER